VVRTIRTIINNNNTTTRRISIRKALRYSGCSKNMYYCKDRRNKITTAATAVIAATAVTPSITTIELEIQQIFMTRPTYATKRMAAMQTRVLVMLINRKRVQRIFRKMGYITPSKSKKEILRTKIPNVKASRPNQDW
jgi:hypothetical protein